MKLKLMRGRWPFLLLVANLLLLPFQLRTAQAIPLTDTAITSGAFGALVGASVAVPLVSGFDYAPGVVGTDGSVTSQVFAGAGAAAGLYVYVYQINHFVTSSEVEVGGMSFDFGTNPTLTPVGGMTSFVISGPGLPPPPGAPFVSGTVTTTFADWTGGSLSFGGSPPVPWLAPGFSSYVFGTFSPLLPTTVISDVLDGGATLASASVYSPVPEPATLLLLGSGLVGMGWFGRKKVKGSADEEA